MRVYRLVFVAALLAAVSNASCSTLSTSSGQQVPLNQLKPVVMTINQIFGNPPKNQPYIWSLDLCNGQSPSPTGVSKACTAPGYVQEYSSPSASCEQTFTTVQTAWSWNGTAANAVFATAGNYLVNVGIICGDSTDLVSLWPAYASQGSSGQVTWGMQFSCKAACPRGGTAVPGDTLAPWNGGSGSFTITIEAKVGCTGGCAFVIIIFVGFFVYVVVAILWNYFRLGKRGREIAPHPEFWKSLPGLVKDGFVFVFTKLRGLCQRGGGSSAGGYSTV